MPGVNVCGFSDRFVRVSDERTVVHIYKRAENNIDRTEKREDFQGYETGGVLSAGLFKGESAT